MAVKQYPTESSHCSETPKYNITKILEYIEGIDLDVELETNRTEVCKRIVDLLGKSNFYREYRVAPLEYNILIYALCIPLCRSCGSRLR